MLIHKGELSRLNQLCWRFLKTTAQQIICLIERRYNSEMPTRSNCISSFASSLEFVKQSDKLFFSFSIRMIIDRLGGGLFALIKFEEFVDIPDVFVRQSYYVGLSRPIQWRQTGIRRTFAIARANARRQSRSIDADVFVLISLLHASWSCRLERFLLFGKISETRLMCFQSYSFCWICSAGEQARTRGDRIEAG